MHNVAFGYALLAGVSMATYIIGLRLASSDVHPALGTAVITGIACLINVAVTLYLWAGGTPIAFSVESLRFLIVVGVATGHREPVHAARLRERTSCDVVVRDRRHIYAPGPSGRVPVPEGALHMGEASRDRLDRRRDVPTPWR